MSETEAKFGEITSTLVGGIPPEPYETSVDGAPILVTPPGWETREQEHLLARPRRIRVHEQFKHLGSWLEYVNRFALSSSAVFVAIQQSELKAEAKLDYHDFDEPMWCDHSAKFITSPTPAWLAWSAGDQKFVKQSEFADFLYQNQGEIREPAGADLLEIITTLKATAAGEFREFRDDFSGSSELIYRMKVSAQGGTTEKPLSLPNQFQVVLEPFYGCPPLELQADLRVRAPTKDGDPLLLGYRFYRIEDQFDQLAESIMRLIADSTKLPVWR